MTESKSNLHHPDENVSIGRRVRDFLGTGLLSLCYTAPVVTPEMHYEVMARHEATQGPSEVEQYLRSQTEKQ